MLAADPSCLKKVFCIIQYHLGCTFIGVGDATHGKVGKVSPCLHLKNLFSSISILKGKLENCQQRSPFRTYHISNFKYNMLQTRCAQTWFHSGMMDGVLGSWGVAGYADQSQSYSAPKFMHNT
jgi:hypothetical protein